LALDKKSRISLCIQNSIKSIEKVNKRDVEVDHCDIKCFILHARADDLDLTTRHAPSLDGILYASCLSSPVCMKRCSRDAFTRQANWSASTVTEDENSSSSISIFTRHFCVFLHNLFICRVFGSKFFHDSPKHVRLETCSTTTIHKRNVLTQLVRRSGTGLLVPHTVSNTHLLPIPNVGQLLHAIVN
jgi:hypothetical protein